MHSDIRKIVFLPTAQHDPNNPWIPNERGISRTKAAASCLAQHPDAVLVIAGGSANHRGVTYSDRMAAYIEKNRPELLERLVLVSGSKNRTIEDIFQGVLLLGGLLEEQGIACIPSSCTFFFCSEKEHYLRAEQTIKTLGFNPVHVESGADSSIYGQRDTQMAEEIVPGKLLALGPEATEWGQKALETVAETAEESRQWAKQHPDEDTAHWEAIQRLFVVLEGRNIYVESPAYKQTRPRPPIPTFAPLD